MTDLPAVDTARQYRYCVLCWKDRNVSRRNRWRLWLSCGHSIDRPRGVFSD